MQRARLQELAGLMKISRMAVHKHLVQLQKRGLVESIEIRDGVGRPKMFFQLTSQSKTIFPKSYAALAVCALDYIQKQMGKKSVQAVLEERQQELYHKYYKRLKGLSFQFRDKSKHSIAHDSTCRKSSSIIAYDISRPFTLFSSSTADRYCLCTYS